MKTTTKGDPRGVRWTRRPARGRMEQERELPIDSNAEAVDSFADPAGSESAAAAVWFVDPPAMRGSEATLRYQARNANGGDPCDELSALRMEAGSGASLSTDPRWAPRWHSIRARLMPLRCGRAASEGEGRILADVLRAVLEGEGGGIPASSRIAAAGFLPRHDFTYPTHRALIWTRKAGSGSIELRVDSNGYAAVEYVASSGGAHTIGSINGEGDGSVPISAAVAALIHLSNLRAQRPARGIRFPIA